jgi:hypothetical protein
MSVIRSRTYAAAAPELVAMTLTMLAPIASRMSTPNRMVRAGITRMPPPTPASAPITPARTETEKIPMSAPIVIGAGRPPGVRSGHAPQMYR